MRGQGKRFTTTQQGEGQMKSGKLILAALGLSGAICAPVMATDGYFSHGYGMRAKGMGGAATALTGDAYGGANNPAAMAWSGNVLNVDLDYFSPQRSTRRTGSGGFGAGPIDFAVDSDSENFFIPAFGYNRMINPDLAVGVTVYGNGGMNTDYAGGQINCGAGPNTANALCGQGRLGVDLMQLIVAPTLAYKLDERHSIGVSPLFAYQRFKAEGLQAFDNAPGFPPLTGAPGSVTNRGYDSARGIGVRIGYLGQFSDRISFGAAYSSEIDMSRFDKYKGLFAGQGDFDIPENYNAGIAFKATPDVLIALDYQRINYAKVPSVGNPSTNQAPLGSNGGPGFGWRNINVFKLGVEYVHSKALTLRAGYNHSENPVQARDVTFNILAPGVIEDHVTLGLTYALDERSEITASYMHAFENSVTGDSLFNALAGPGAGGRETITMSQNSLGVAYGYRF
jgi:long-chain fatty acid transport protein